ncbi:MAG: hypothetical protein CSA15_09325 [Candidatus Delongbacteria bacterium]|nr:MAG: hypothetical protein CSA15_09325 [Candidatus Delongbacteria bacterium]
MWIQRKCWDIDKLSRFANKTSQVFKTCEVLKYNQTARFTAKIAEINSFVSFAIFGIIGFFNRQRDDDKVGSFPSSTF